MFRVGLVGAGLMGRYHAAGWAQTPAPLAAVFSRDPVRAAALAGPYGALVVDSLDALIQAVDVVDICTPTHRHYEQVLLAAAAGKHIICEKPLARTPQQGAEMIAACERADVWLLVGHVLRFFPEYAQAQAIVESGQIGRVGTVRLKRVSAMPTWAVENWLFDAEKSGGIMLDLMIHDYDYARWIAGEVESVYARSGGRSVPGAPGDYALVLLRHTSGALSHIEGGWCNPAGMFRTALEIAGDAGLIEHPAGSSVPIATYLKQPGQAQSAAVPSSPLLEDPYVTQIKHFYEVIAHGAAPRITAGDALAALNIACAALESVRTGQRVRVGEGQPCG